MANAGELLREAQYAYQNVSHGDSPDNRKKTARAKSVARKIIRKFPTSSEADQARQILERLDPKSMVQSKKHETEHLFEQRDQHEQVDPHHGSTEGNTGKTERSTTRDWKKLLLRLTQIHSTSRNIILAALFLLVVYIPFAGFFIVAAIIFLLGPFGKHHPQGTKEGLDKLYVQLDDWISKH